MFIGRTDDEAEAPIIWPPDAKSWLIRKDPEAGKEWRQEEKGMTEDEMVGWHHQLDGYEFEQALGVGDGQGSLVCCSPWGHKESDMTKWLNWTELNNQNQQDTYTKVTPPTPPQHPPSSSFSPFHFFIRLQYSWVGLSKAGEDKTL